jgi:hypothetical protein
MLGDGGVATTGVCSPLRALNAPCGDFTTSAADGEEACSYRRSGNTGNHCDFNAPDAGDWTCKAGLGLNAACQTGIWCSAAACDLDTLTCTSPDNYWAAFGTCPYYVLP